MNSSKKQANGAGPTQTPANASNQLLHRIRNAELPRHAGQFTLAELDQAGLTAQFENNQTKGWPESLFKTLVLLAIQNKELRRERDRLQQEIEENNEYYSPIRDELRNERDLLKREEIKRRAEADEARVARDRAEKEQSRSVLFRKMLDDLSRQPWIFRDQSHLPREPVFWHEPMTVMNYHQATGLSRRTLQNVLRRIKATPTRSPTASSTLLATGDSSSSSTVRAIDAAPARTTL